MLTMNSIPILLMLVSLRECVLAARQARTDARCDSGPQYNDRSKVE